jgi:hypothetical protein
MSTNAEGNVEFYWEEALVQSSGRGGYYVIAGWNTEAGKARVFKKHPGAIIARRLVEKYPWREIGKVGENGTTEAD